MIDLRLGDCREVMASMPADSIDAIVTDPPYGLSFMGKGWDHGVPGVEFWTEALRVAKPGAHLLAFGGTRTHHRLMVAIEDAGWEIRDCLMWLYGSGFPKSLDVSKAIDKAGPDPLAWRAFSRAYAAAVATSPFSHADIDRSLNIKSSSCYWAREDHRGGLPPRHHWEQVAALLSLPDEFVRLYDEAEREVLSTQPGRGATGVYGAFSDDDYKRTAPATEAARQWDGWGTALKPAWEPVIVARKPLVGTVADNVLRYGTGALNIDGSRIGTDERHNGPASTVRVQTIGRPNHSGSGWREDYSGETVTGRWPANVILDEEAARLVDAQSGDRPVSGTAKGAKPGAPSVERGAKTNAFGPSIGSKGTGTVHNDEGGASRFFYTLKGRWPANVILDEESAAALDEQSEGGMHSAGHARDVIVHPGERDPTSYNTGSRPHAMPRFGDSGGASRFFYTAKASRSERTADGHVDNRHPTVKPTDLMEYLVRLVTPPGGTVLDPFMGSGSTGVAAEPLGFSFVGIELEPESFKTAKRRLARPYARSLFGRT